MILANESLVSVLIFRAKRFIFQRLTLRSRDLFLRGNEIISEAILLEGIYEKPLTDLIDEFSKQGLSDFFIDIGANIGVSSCQNGNSFDKVYAVEPNPLCVHVLKVNLAISLDEGDYSIIECGLGKSSGEFDLCVPKHNWGGAFIRSEENSYTEEILARKDGFDKISPNNYIVKKIRVEPADEVLAQIFSELMEKGYKSGVIKIDVEGFEMSVLQGIADSLPSNISVAICFENWDGDFDFERVRTLFSKRRMNLKIIESSWSQHVGPDFLKYVIAILGRPRVTEYRALIEARVNTGDIVIELFDCV